MAAALLLAGCASAPFEAAEVDSAVTPSLATAEPQAYEGETVIWGGTIVDIRNQPERTVVEVLSYPLGSDQRPDTDEDAGHRFVAVRQGYLEPADYAPGEIVTVKGRLDGVQAGSVGEREYVYPVVRAEGLKLWREDDPRSAVVPRFSIGIGVILN